MTVRNVLGTGALVAICVACSSASIQQVKYPSTKGMTPREAKAMFNAAYERQIPYRELALAERERIWRVGEDEK